MQMIFDGLATQGPILVEGPLTGHLPARVLSDSFSNASPRRSEEHTSELQSPCNLVCRLLLEKKKNQKLTLPVYSTPRFRYLVAPRPASGRAATFAYIPITTQRGEEYPQPLCPPSTFASTLT